MVANRAVTSSSSTGGCQTDTRVDIDRCLHVYRLVRQRLTIDGRPVRMIIDLHSEEPEEEEEGQDPMIQGLVIGLSDQRMDCIMILLDHRHPRPRHHLIIIIMMTLHTTGLYHIRSYI